VRQAHADLLADGMDRKGFDAIQKDFGGRPSDRTALGMIGSGLSRLRLFSDKKDLPNPPAAIRLQEIRLLQLMFGDIGPRAKIGSIWEGYMPRVEFEDQEIGPRFAKLLAPLFPNGDHDLDYEVARTLGLVHCADADVRSRVLLKCDANSSPIDDIHYLACYAQMNGKRTDKETPLVAATLLDLDRKIAARKLNRAGRRG
jgi:hypothetical protein